MSEAAFLVLVVEDDPDDVFFLQAAFKDAGAPSPEVARDGEEALARLSASPAPSLVLLDLKLPKLSGLEVLERRTADPALRSIPVVVLTSSNTAEDRERAYALGANAYLVKPIGAAEQREMVRSTLAFWKDLNKVPGP